MLSISNQNVCFWPLGEWKGRMLFLGEPKIANICFSKQRLVINQVYYILHGQHPTPSLFCVKAKISLFHKNGLIPDTS